MKSFEYVITDPVGIHARPAGIIIKEIKKFASTVMIAKGDKSVDMKRGPLGVMGLKVKQGDTVKLTIEGPNEAEAAATIETFFKENF